MKANWTLETGVIAAGFEHLAITDRESLNPIVCSLSPVQTATPEDVERGEFILKACGNHDALVAAVKRMLPWMGRLIAEGAHLNSVAPNDAVGAMHQAEAVLKAINKK